MRLKSVELHGFKSFPERTTIEFGAGVTAILGPNGCGKSNVVDAIKWALGEKSAKSLRGEEMLDVVFAGCESRAASGVAEVKLNLDNADQSLPLPYNEISVTRRLHRSRESEYFINHNRCRLKDIRDLFLDTGVGNGAYAVIEQNRVEALLNAKPADRRAVLEEAAGIAKFKARRRETLSRLERTDQILLRVNDRVLDKERQIRRVSAQAAAARRYRRLKAEQDSLRERLYRRRHAALAADRERLEAELEALRGLLAREDATAAEALAKSAGLTELETELAIAREAAVAAHARTQDRLTNIHIARNDAKNRMEALRSEMAMDRERSLELERRVADLRESGRALAGRLETLRGRSREIEAEFAARDRERRESLEAASRAEAEVAALRNELLDVNQSRRQAAENAARFEARGQSGAGRLGELEDRLRDARGRAEALTAGMRAAESSAAAAAERAAVAGTALAEAKESFAAASGALESLLREERALVNERSARDARRAALEDLEHSFAGAYEGVKSVLQAALAGESACGGVAGMAGDLMTVPLDLALAVETLLGASAQDIVVATARDAQAAIEYLKRGRLGRATFLPLDRIQPRRRLDRDFRHIPGVIGEAVDLVGFDPRHRAVMEHLLAGVLVVESLDLARRLSGGEARGVRIVTREGDVINPSGSMAGGHGRQQRAGLVRRKAELDALAEEIARIDSRIGEIRERGQGAVRAREEAERGVVAAERGRAELDRLEADAREALAVARSAALRAGDDLESARGEYGKAQAASGDWERELAEARERLAAIDARLSGIEAALAEKTGIQRGARQAADAMGEGFAELSGERARAASEVGEAERQLSAVLRDCRESEEKLTASSGSGVSRAAELELLHAAIQRFNQEEEGLLRRRDEEDDTRVELAERLRALREDMEEARRTEREAQLQMSRLRDGMNELERRRAECAVHLDNLREKAKEELGIEDLTPPPEAETAPRPVAYGEDDPDAGEAGLFSRLDGGTDPGVGLPAASAPPWAGLSDAELAARIDEAAQKIKKIGPVNFEAIDELAELEAGVEFLRGQKEDLDGAVREMRAAIDRLNRESASRFEETFAVVRAHFQRMFTKLFGGGKADLVLVEPEGEDADPLDLGIDVKAQPPGKEPKSISLLSGGEKALCAVALLFALFRAKPSPFCILDEVDGPLDESNIDRFMHQVREFAADTQFIIITHSQRTMSMTDAIWGVSQQTPGVSIVRSLRFVEMDKISREAPEEERLAGA
ncbi:MAG: chromosome segregation protein SMC [Planctomycetota bacterium]|jgi:chromosome segregation protein|nr:chromosome segregation protein SMC [Planctomycetota bacterium]